MAAANSTRARGVQVSEYSWGIIYRGTREMLIQHGHAQDGLFPGDPGAGKTREKSTDPLGRAIKIKRASKYIFDVRRYWNDEESAAFYKAEKMRREQQEEIERATRTVNEWPKSAGAFRDEVHMCFSGYLDALDKLASSGMRGGYRYTDDTILRLRLMASQMLALVDSGAVVKDLALREDHTPACISRTVRAADAARQDNTFQRFMAGVTK